MPSEKLLLLLLEYEYLDYIEYFNLRDEADPYIGNLHCEFSQL